MSAEEPRDVARLREAFASLEDDGTGEPVAPERLFDAVNGRLSAEERQALVDDLLTNPGAAEGWRLAQEMSRDSVVGGVVGGVVDGIEDGIEDGARDHARETSMRSGAWKWLSLAAAAVLALGLGWQVMLSRGAEEPAYRSVDSRAIASALAPDATLSRAQPVLHWTEVEGARYRVRVLTADLQMLDESAETTSREYTLSQQTLARIPPDGRILWQVEARIPGEGVITSPTFSIRVP